MKLIKYALPIIVLPFIALSSLATLSASADNAGTLQCYGNSGLHSSGCDLSVDKQVSVGESDFSEAPTEDTAVTAVNGNTVTWQITVASDSQSGDYLTGEVTLSDVLPSGVTFVSYTTSDETTYDPTSGAWTIDLGEGDQTPDTLTIVTTVNSNTYGYIENTATLTGYSLCGVNGSLCVDPPYNDYNPNNNSASAYIHVPAPVVTNTPTPSPTVTVTSAKAPNTGFNVKTASVTNDALGYSLVALTLAGIGFRLRSLRK